MALDLRESASGLTLRVRVQPRAAQDALAGERDGALVVRLKAPPVEGAANEALARFLGKALDVPPSAVRIVTGGSRPQQARGSVRDRRGDGARAALAHDRRRPADPRHRPARDARGTRPAHGRRAARARRCCEDAARRRAGGRIAWVGPDAEAAAAVRLRPGAEALDAAGAAVVPGFVDAHTHLAFAGDRDDEIRRRLAGASYQEIAAAGGGIVRTVAATRAATAGELAALVASRLDEMLLCGTTTAEVKSGYGLETAAEIRSLEAIRLAAARHPVRVVPTFLGAHEVPPEQRSDRERYVRLLVEEMIPAVAERGLAVFADVFCEQGVFSVPESRRILLAARERGMKLRIHADELGCDRAEPSSPPSCGARSADHLIHVSPAGMRALAARGHASRRCFRSRPSTCGSAASLRRARSSRRACRSRSPSDVNPGGGLSPSLPFAMALGCFGMGLSLEEALAAVTVNAAHSLDLAGEVGLDRDRQARRPRAAALAAAARPGARRRSGDPGGGEGRPGGRARRTPRRVRPERVPVRALSIHADYGCRHSGACCRSGWDIAAEPAVEARSTPRVAAGRLGVRAPWSRPLPGLPHGARVVLRVSAARRVRLLREGRAPPVRGAPRARPGSAALGLPAVPARGDAHAARRVGDALALLPDGGGAPVPRRRRSSRS